MMTLAVLLHAQRESATAGKKCGKKRSHVNSRLNPWKQLTILILSKDYWGVLHPVRSHFWNLQVLGLQTGIWNISVTELSNENCSVTPAEFEMILLLLVFWTLHHKKAIQVYVVLMSKGHLWHLSPFAARTPLSAGMGNSCNQLIAWVGKGCKREKGNTQRRKWPAQYPKRCQAPLSLWHHHQICLWFPGQWQENFGVLQANEPEKSVVEGMFLQMACLSH